MARPLGRSLSVVAFALLVAAAACGRPARVALPAGPGQPAADAADWLAEATVHCATLRSLTAEMALSGRIDGRRVRARVLAGTDASGRVRLEALAPFGAPVFVLGADEAGATLVLPREARVVSGTSVEELLEALAGLPLSGADLHAALAGCGLARRTTAGGRAHGDQWRALVLADGGTLWVERRGPAARLAVAALPGLSVEYGAGPGGGRTVRLVAGGPGPAARVDVTLVLSQVEENVALAPDAFRVTPPPDAVPMSIRDLRQRGLLAGGAR